MNELLKEMITILKEEVKSANVILFTMDSTDIRWDTSLEEMLSELEGLFGERMWQNVMIEMR